MANFLTIYWPVSKALEAVYTRILNNKSPSHLRVQSGVILYLSSCENFHQYLRKWQIWQAVAACSCWQSYNCEKFKQSGIILITFKSAAQQPQNLQLEDIVSPRRLPTPRYMFPVYILWDHPVVLAARVGHWTIERLDVPDGDYSVWAATAVILVNRVPRLLRLSVDGVPGIQVQFQF